MLTRPSANGAVNAAPLVQALGMTYAYAGGRPVVDAVSLALGKGERLALVGPNGAGKTTLLRLLSGTLAPQAGEVWWEGRPLRSMRRRELGQRIAVVPQRSPGGTLEELTVEELVALGRTPHAGWLGLRGETAADRAAIADALLLTGADALAGRPLAELSGGEQQRALLAMALAQESELLLLDEPTRYLDPHHQVALLDLVVELTAARRLAVVAVLHDLDLAAFYFPRLVLMQRGAVEADGAPADVLTNEAVARVYGSGLRVARDPEWPEMPLVLPARPAPALRATSAGQA